MSTLVSTANLKPSILVYSQDTKLIIPKIPANDGLNTEVFLLASLQVIDVLNIYLTSIFPLFSGRTMPTLANKAKLIIKLGIIPDIPADDGPITKASYDADISDSFESALFDFVFLDTRKPQIFIPLVIPVICNAPLNRKNSTQVKPKIVELMFLILLILPLVAVKVSSNSGSSSPFISPPAKIRNRNFFVF